MALIIAPVAPAQQRFRRYLDRPVQFTRIFKGAVANGNDMAFILARLSTLTAASSLLSPEDIDVLTQTPTSIDPVPAPYNGGEAAQPGQPAPGALVDEEG